MVAATGELALVLGHRGTERMSFIAADMKKKCAPACLSCEYLTVEGRCPIDPDAPNAWGPGDLDEMFQKLTQEPYLSKYEVEILSSPAKNGGPWVITMENVVTQEEEWYYYSYIYIM